MRDERARPSPRAAEAAAGAERQRRPQAAAQGEAEPPRCPLCAGVATRPLFEKKGYSFRRCRGCGLVRIHPIPSSDALSAVYERSYQEGLYAVFANDRDVRLAAARDRLRQARRFAPPGPWLDVGCSTGAFLEAAAEEGIDIEGIEWSAAAVAEARGRGLRASRAAAEDFEPARRYAFVTAFDVLEHLADPNAWLARVRTWLAEDGRLALTVPDIGSLPARLMGRYWYYYAPPEHVTYFDRRTALRLLARHGLVPVGLERAAKALTVNYALAQLEAFNPLLFRIARGAARVVPAPLRTRSVAVPLGELLIVARA